MSSKLSFLGFKRGTSRNLSNSSSINQTRFRNGGVPKEEKANQKSNVGRIFQFRRPSVKKDEMRIIFDKFDTNRDGKISEEEYMSAVELITMGKGGGGGGGGGGKTMKTERGKEFKAADSNGDGFIDFEEFVKIHENTESTINGDIENAFKVFDVDGNGKISPEELLEVLSRLGEKSSLDACSKIVRGLDADGDGFINMDEFMIMMTCPNNNI